MVTSEADRPPTEIEFNFEKGNFFRVIHVDGAFGGISPTGLLHMAVYNERSPVPKKIVQKVDESGKLGSEIPERRNVRSGVFRELEADLVFTIETAVALRDWLDDKIKQHAAALAAMAKAPEAPKPGEKQ